MSKHPLTEGQHQFIAVLRLTNTDARALAVVEASCHYRNANAPSGAMDRREIREDLFSLIDAVS